MYAQKNVSHLSNLMFFTRVLYVGVGRCTTSILPILILHLSVSLFVCMSYVHASSLVLAQPNRCQCQKKLKPKAAVS